MTGLLSFDLTRVEILQSDEQKIAQPGFSMAYSMMIVKLQILVGMGKLTSMASARITANRLKRRIYDSPNLKKSIDG